MSASGSHLTHNQLPPSTTGMSERRAPGSGFNGIELIKAIWTLEELERLSQEEKLEVGVGDCPEASQGIAAKVLSEKIEDLLATLRAKAESPLVSSAELNPDLRFSYERPCRSPA